MTEQEAIRSFLSKALRKDWQPRYLSLVETKRGKQTILADLYHVLGERFDPAHLKTIPESTLSKPAFLFSETDGFGKECPSMREAESNADEGALVVSADGKHGILIEETIKRGMQHYSV